MKHVFFSVLLLLISLTLSLSFAANLKADIISIDFENLSYGDAVYDQYSSDEFGGVIFDVYDTSTSPGNIATVGIGGVTTKALKAESIDPGIFILFPTTPVYSVSTYVTEGPLPVYDEEDPPQAEPPPLVWEESPEPEYEAPEQSNGSQEEPNNTVYLWAYELADSNYNLLDTNYNSVHAEGSWEELSFSSVVPIAAVQLVGTRDFWLNNIVISTTFEPVPASVPVPEPSTMLLLGFGLTGLVCFRNRLKKR